MPLLRAESSEKEAQVGLEAFFINPIVASEIDAGFHTNPKPIDDDDVLVLSCDVSSWYFFFRRHTLSLLCGKKRPAFRCRDIPESSG